MKRAVSLFLVLLLCLASIPFAAADQEVDGTVVSLESGILTLELANGNRVILNCDINTNAAAGDSVTITYTGKLGISAAVKSIRVRNRSDAFIGTVTDCYGDHFTVTADTGARITFLIDENTYMTGTNSNLQVGMKVSVTYTGDVTSDIYAVHIAVNGSSRKPDPTEAPYSNSPVKKYGRSVNSASSLSIGDVVTFGSYEQDGYTGNGKEDIEWIVLDIKGGHVLLLSKYGLDMYVYNSEPVKTTWSTSSMRSFLNGSFYNTAFSSDEKQIIVTTNVDNSSSQGNSESLGGPSTKDNVFLLSRKEAWNYLPTPYDRMCAPTNYALQRFAMSSAKYEKDGESTTYWWLRSGGRTDIVALVILSDGSEGHEIVSYGYNARDNMYHAGCCIRPAVWVDLG